MPVARILKALKRLPFVPRSRPAAGGAPRFWAMVESFEQRLRKYPHRGEGRLSSGKGRVGVLITPWLRTAAPMYSMEIALALADVGADVTIIWDVTDVMGNTSDQSEIDTLAKLLPLLPHSLKLVNLTASRGATSYSADDHKWAVEMFKENAIARLRKEGGAEAYAEEHAEDSAQMATHLGRVRDHLTAARYDWILVPGGIYALSGIYLEAARQLNLSYTTYDSGYAMIVIHDGVATHQSDIPQAARLLRADPEYDRAAEDFIVRQATEEIDTRKKGKGNSLQIVAAGANDFPRGDVVVPMNLRWDSAALCRLKLFPSVEAWITGLANWAKQRGDVRVCFRQHPCERDPAARAYDDIPALLASLDPEGKHTAFIRAEDPVSTYDLLEQAKVVLPFTSTVGIEAALLGKPIILSTHCYYESFSFAHAPATPEEYFALLDRALAGELQPNEAAIREAALVYYLAQICLYLYTPFIIDNLEYQKWVAMSPEELWALPESQDLMEALLTRTPVSCVRHRKKLARSSAPV